VRSHCQPSDVQHKACHRRFRPKSGFPTLTMPHAGVAQSAASARALKIVTVCKKSPRSGGNPKGQRLPLLCAPVLPSCHSVPLSTLFYFIIQSRGTPFAHHAAGTHTRNSVAEGLAQLFDVRTTSRRLALQEARTGDRREGRQGRCPHPEHSRCLAGATAVTAGARLQSRRLLQRPAIEAVPCTRDGPLVRRHDGRRDLSRNDAASGRQTHLYGIFFSLSDGQRTV
jgi:hypothetical protein